MSRPLVSREAALRGAQPDPWEDHEWYIPHDGKTQIMPAFRTVDGYLIITQEASFSCITGWTYAVQERVAILASRCLSDMLRDSELFAPKIDIDPLEITAIELYANWHVVMAQDT